jgi:hypothetical protein
MLLNNPIPPGEYRHNYVRLAFLVGTLLLFIGHIVVNQLHERGNNRIFLNATLHAEELVVNDITPSDWVYQSLDALNYLWQLAWLLYSLTFIYRRSTSGYLYLSPKTLSLTFYIVYIIGFLIQTIWLLFFNQTYTVWSWIIYLISFLLLSLALFVININLAINKKIYEIEGLNGDIWSLRFLAQNGIAFFACLTALRFVLALDAFLQLKFTLSIANAGTISLILAALIAGGFFFEANFNVRFVERCAYQFSPWIVFLIFFWGVIQNNWIPKNATRNNIIAVIELIATIISAIAALALFSMRYRASKIDPIA